MEAVALERVIVLFVVYFVAGLIPLIAIAVSKTVSRYDCMAWGGLLIYLAAFMLVPLTELLTMIEMYVEHGCEYDFAKRECGRVLTETDFNDLRLFKQYVLLFSFLFTFAIGGTGINLFSQGVAGRGSFISEDAERQFRLWIGRIERNQKTLFYLLLASLVLSLISLFLVGCLIQFIS